MVDINPGVQQVSEALNKEQENATHWVACDVCKPEAIREYFDQAVKHFGQIGIVVNNAGIINKRSLFDQTDHHELELLIRLNLFAPMEATRIAVQYFKETDRQGAVVNTASVGGLMPVSFMETYGTTKAGLVFFTASCKDLAPQVRVNAVAPYFADTPLVANSPMLNSFPLLLKSGLVTPEKVVEAMLKAMCDKTMAGDTLMVTVGKEERRITMYDDLAVQLSSYITSGLIKGRLSSLGRFLSSFMRRLIRRLRKPPDTN
ncbi:hypothetical protein LPJ62_006054 [Coemansia sp. RSA 2167]|nr:hypothetical protein LPJ62_006054 [Coemansia sp. RSA 2167]KAJ2220614.1 hypothetical protein IW143_002180 [Coemansia sp. RSA 520]KAJ2276924.1 hypothetical protein J3F81_001167 [Coemansia sp. RSA 371]